MVLIASNEKEKKKMIFHKSRCFYVNRINRSNYRMLDNDYVRNHNYHTCKYCDGFAGDMRIYKKHMDRVSLNENIRFYANYEKETLFVETSVGLWRLYRDSECSEYVLYHHNFYKKGMDVNENMSSRRFHRQIDVRATENLEKLFNYIIAHDKAKEIIAVDYRNLPKTTKKQKKYYRQAMNRDKRKQINRVDHLFTMIEAQHTDYKKLSIG